MNFVPTDPSKGFTHETDQNRRNVLKDTTTA
jgi:hypothetical protein